MRNEVYSLLKASIPALLSRSPEIGNIKGGIVMAHPNVTYDIQGTPPFRIGKILGWMTYYQKAPLLSEMTGDDIFQVAEVLLKKHQSLNRGEFVFSMKQRLAELIQVTEQNIQAWIDMH